MRLPPPAPPGDEKAQEEETEDGEPPPSSPRARNDVDEHLHLAVSFHQLPPFVDLVQYMMHVPLIVITETLQQLWTAVDDSSEIVLTQSLKVITEVLQCVIAVKVGGQGWG